MFVTNAMLCQFALYVKSIPPWGVMGKKANLRRVGGAVFGVFLLSGWALASWMARIPEIRDHLGLTPGELGRILLVGAVGAVLALTTAGLVVDRLGAAFTVRAGAMSTAVGLVSTGIGASTVASAVIVAAGLFACGYGLAAWDVAMNVEGAAVERLQGRALMPRLHAGFSLGTVAGAGLGAGAAAIKAPVALHLGVVGGFVLLTVLMLVRYFTPRHTAEADTTSHGHARLRDAWREPRTMLIGVVVLAFALAEGVANEWLAVGLVDGFDVPPALGVVGFAMFLTAMTVTRHGRWLPRRPLGPGRGAAHQRRDRDRGGPPGGLRWLTAGRAARRGGVGSRRRARFPARHERGRRRSGTGGRPRQCGVLHRLHRLPRRPAVAGLAR